MSNLYCLPWAAAVVACLCGCGPKAPFQLTDVSGTVKYEGGELIPGDRIVLTFHPQDMAAVGKSAPKVARAEVDVSTGEFSSATTWKPGDGVIVGPHKVTVEALRTLPNGIDAPNGAVSPSYQRPSETPLAVTIERGGDPLELFITPPQR